MPDASHPSSRQLDVAIVERPEGIRAADRVVLPGQGAMPDCMRCLREFFRTILQNSICRWNIAH